MNKSIFASMAVILSSLFLPISPVRAATLDWLDKTPPPAPVGVTWGTPWARGTITKDQAFALTTPDGKSLPLQSWPLAYWPDGSIKWTAFATVAGPDTKGPLQIAPRQMLNEPIGRLEAVGDVVKVTQTDTTISLDTGKIQASIPKTGQYLIDSLTVGGKEVARHGQLECILQNGPETDALNLPPRQLFVSELQKVTVEQTGPVRAVVKFEGMHKLKDGDRQWLPFVVRLYFYAGEEPIRVVHTIVYDGDQDKDFIRGLGLVFDVPMREQLQNRHIRFANSNGGVWAEPLQLAITGGRGRGGLNAGGGDQIEGQRLPNRPASFESASWDAFKLVQPNSDGFTIIKRTNPKSSWVPVAEGQRAAGLVFIGDVSGGLAVGVKNFWQMFPASLEVQNATTDTAQLHVWLWSPDAPGMDMRHYDTRGHGNVNTGGSYEDYEPAFATPYGVGRTSELMLFPMSATPTRAQTAKLAAVNSAPPLLTTTPDYLHSTGVFGVWSVQDRSTPFKKSVEDRLDAAIDFYQKQIEEHHFYGFWNFGDVRHSYDPQRHEWRYDVGGFAWDNSELGSVLWVWYSYIRTGRADIFRMAEAMIRATSEVDTYHLGPYTGLGSRHNVSHWGDSAKEARVSQAAHARFLYYLTADERLGDILDVEANVDEVESKLDPMRKAQPITQEDKKYPGRIRFGPDWLAIAGNWMTQWERTGDTKWRDKIMAGADSMYAMPFWMRSGVNLTMGYDYKTSKLYYLSDVEGSNVPGRYNLPTIQGGAEVAFELTPLLNNDEWTKMWSQYCRLGTADAATLTRDQQTGTEGADATLIGEQGGNNSQGAPRLAAYAYYLTKNPAFAKRAIASLADRAGGTYTTHKVDVPDALNPLDEAPMVSTNETAQSSLQAIEILELCADQLPTNPLPPTQGFGGRGGGGGRGARGAGAGGRGAAGSASEPAQ